MEVLREADCPSHIAELLADHLPNWTVAAAEP